MTVYETDDEGWAWGQLESDGYVGWLPTAALLAPGPAPTHRVAALRTLRVSRAVDQGAAGRGAAARRQDQDRAHAGRVCGLGQRLSAGAGTWCRSTSAEPDFVAVAERFVGAPYLWGGKTSLGVDCSGLVQVSLNACGIPSPRDSDMQEAALGSPVASSPI